MILRNGNIGDNLVTSSLNYVMKPTANNMVHFTESQGDLGDITTDTMCYYYWLQIH